MIDRPRHHLRPGLGAAKFNDPDALIDFRTPRFDLDSLYGRGPAYSPCLYEWTDQRFRGIKLLAGRPPRFDPRTAQDLGDPLPTETSPTTSKAGR